MSKETTLISVRVRKKASAKPEVVELRVTIEELGNIPLGNPSAMAKHLKPLLEDKMDAEVIPESITNVKFDGSALLSSKTVDIDKDNEETDPTEHEDEEVIYLGSDSMLKKPFSLIPGGGFVIIG